MKNSLLQCVGTLLLISTTGTAGAENWPAWRGPLGTGVSGDQRLPTQWSETQNVRWRVDLPGPGNSSPIVWGDRVFISQSLDDEDRRTLMCFDRANGELLWQSGVTYKGEEPTHRSNPYAAGTPATDGQLVYVCFGSPGVYAYDFSGKEAWHRSLGELTHVFGTAVSPILYGDLCILNFGPGQGTRLIALNKKNGETVWETTPPQVDPSELAPAGGRFGGGPGGPGGPGSGRPGPGGPGGRRGPGGFGPGSILAPQILAQADADGDKRATPVELAALADAWFDKLDTDRSGKLNQEQLVERLDAVLPRPEGFGPGARFLGPGLFTAVDADTDGSLTRAELKETFGKWAEQWDAEKTGSLSEDQLRDGLTAALPQSNFAAPGGGGPGRGGPANMGGSWSTPIVVTADGRDELIVAFPGRLVAYEPETGSQLWTSKGLGGTIYTTPLVGEGAIVAMTSGPGGGSAIAVQRGGRGDITDTHRIWRLDRIDSQMGSGVIHEGYLYTISQDGIAACINRANGEQVWQKRLRGPGSRGGVWSSMLLADGKIYIPNQSGDVFVLRASPEYELLATNSVGESTNASLAASDGELFLRTDDGLWCFAAAQ